MSEILDLYSYLEEKDLYIFNYTRNRLREVKIKYNDINLDIFYKGDYSIFYKNRLVHIWNEKPEHVINSVLVTYNGIVFSLSYYCRLTPRFSTISLKIL